ncbi:MAG: peptidase C39 [Faecalibacterium sp.]
MPVPLNYQISEYDCGPISMLNALSVQFSRKQIQPSMIKAVFNYTMDSCDSKGRSGQKGTSAAALRFIGKWLNEYNQQCGFPVYCKNLHPNDIFLGKDSKLNIALDNGAVAIVRCLLGTGHYILITKADDTHVYAWDPYHLDNPIRKKTIQTITDTPCSHNRRIHFDQMNQTGRYYYSLGDIEKRECLLIYNTTKSTEMF